MKILILANNSGGLYNFRNELLKELLKDHMVYACVPDESYVPNLTEMGCECIQCKLHRHGMNPVREHIAFTEHS